MYDENIRNSLTNEVEKLIEYGADTFLLGGYGKFDGMAASVLTELKEKYPNIKRILVIPYLGRDFDKKFYDESLYPPIENVPYKFCISKRNEWMIKNSEIVVSYVEFTFGGAYKTLEYARKQKKNIINLFDKPFDGLYKKQEKTDGESVKI